MVESKWERWILEYFIIESTYWKFVWLYVQYQESTLWSKSNKTWVVTYIGPALGLASVHVHPYLPTHLYRKIKMATRDRFCDL